MLHGGILQQGPKIIILSRTYGALLSVCDTNAEQWDKAHVYTAKFAARIFEELFVPSMDPKDLAAFVLEPPVQRGSDRR